MKLKEIADEIDGYLHRFEHDPNVNKLNPRFRAREYFLPYAIQGGKYVRVCYVNYQGATSLTKDEAMAYLEWLRAGNVGKHWDMTDERG